MRKLVAGLGINDLNYCVTPTVGGKQVGCPFYLRWKDMIARCSDINSTKNGGVYADKVVCEDWVFASNFVEWMKFQIWEGLQLDKDILFPGNKVYGPDTCVFVPQWLNKLVITSEASRGKHPLGVSYSSDSKMKNTPRKPYQSSMCIFTGDCYKFKYLGKYESSEKAHTVWQENKIISMENAISLYRAHYSYREDVDNSLRRRVSKLREDVRLGLETKSI